MHPNEVLVRAGYEAMARGDGRVLAKMLRPDSRWVVLGNGPAAGVFVGPDEIFAVWKKTAEQTGGGLRLELHEVLANDQRAVAMVTARGDRKGRTMDERQLVVFEFSDGLITEARFVYENPSAYDEFWS